MSDDWKFNDWKTNPKCSAVRLEIGTVFAMKGVESLLQYGITATDIEHAPGAFIDMDAGCTLTFVATERTRLFWGPQVDRLRAPIEAEPIDVQDQPFARSFATMRHRFMAEESKRIEAEAQRDDARAECARLRDAIEGMKP